MRQGYKLVSPLTAAAIIFLPINIHMRVIIPKVLVGFVKPFTIFFAERSPQ